MEDLVERTTIPADHDDGRKVNQNVRVRHLATLLVWIVAIVLALKFFSAFRIMLLGLLAAAAVACALWPIMLRVRKSRQISAMVVGIGFLGVIAAIIAIIVALLAPKVQKELQQLPVTRQNLDASLQKLSQRFEISPPVDSATLLKQAGNFLGQGGTVATTVGQTLTAVLVALALVLIGSLYFLAEPREKLIGPVLPALPPRRRRQVVAALDDLGPKLRWWLIGVLSSIAIVSVVSGVGYSIAGIKGAIPLAILAGLAEMVPMIGPLIAGIAATMVASTQGSTEAIGAIIVWAIVQTLESYVLLPLIMRQAVHIPAVVTLFSVILWGEVFGAAGLFMAIPINLLIGTMFRHLVIEDKVGDHVVTDPTPARPGNMDVEREAASVEAHPT